MSSSERPVHTASSPTKYSPFPHSDAQAQAYPQRHPQHHPLSQPMPHSILRVRERSSGLDSESPPTIAGYGTSMSYRTSAATQDIPPHPPSQPSASHSASPSSPLPSSHSHSQIPILHSAGQIQNPPRFGYKHGDRSMSSVGRGVGIGSR
jgi:hypothetical protein